MNELIATPAPLASDVSAVRFTGIRSEFRRLILRGALLELLTLGFYRFWLATDMRRHLWSHTEIDGDTAEYTGTAKELLIGFLFALAILIPIYLLYFFITLEAERWQAFASVPLLLFFYLFTQFAIYRARRYRLTRTVWRGARFWMAGSGWAYAWRAFLWSFLIGLTLGLALPWQRAALERYKMAHTFYGDLPGRFAGTGGELFKRGWWLWLLIWPSVFLVIPLPFIYAAFKAIEWRWWISGLQFGAVSANCKMENGALFGLYWKVIGWLAMLLILVFAWIVGVVILASAWADIDLVAASQQQTAALMQRPGVLVAIAGGYIVAALLFGVVMRLYLTRDVWDRIANTTTVYNLAAAENVASRGDAASALGEGLADSLDVGGL